MRWSYAFWIFYLLIIISRIWLNAPIPNGDVQRPSEYDYILYVQLSSAPPPPQRTPRVTPCRSCHLYYSTFSELQRATFSRSAKKELQLNGYSKYRSWRGWASNPHSNRNTIFTHINCFKSVKTIGALHS